jgi:hypothetical protein
MLNCLYNVTRLDTSRHHSCDTPCSCTLPLHHCKHLHSVLPAGTVVTFTAVITNAGNVGLNGISVATTGFVFSGCAVPSSLAVGSSFSCSGSKQFTQADMQNGVAVKAPSTSIVTASAAQLTSAVTDDATVTFIKDARVSVAFQNCASVSDRAGGLYKATVLCCSVERVYCLISTSWCIMYAGMNCFFFWMFNQRQKLIHCCRQFAGSDSIQGAGT